MHTCTPHRTYNFRELWRARICCKRFPSRTCMHSWAWAHFMAFLVCLAGILSGIKNLMRSKRAGVTSELDSHRDWTHPSTFDVKIGAGGESICDGLHAFKLVHCQSWISSRLPGPKECKRYTHRYPSVLKIGSLNAVPEMGHLQTCTRDFTTARRFNKHLFALACVCGIYK